MVVLAIGVSPEISLAQKAGLVIGEKTGAIHVDGHMCTSDPDIYAAGDCVECLDRLTGRPCYVPLGVQITGPGEGSKRIDVAATAITAGMTLDQLAGLDLSYAPPYASAMDNLITAANVARNKRDGYMIGISAESVQRKIQNGEDFVFLDVRSPQEYSAVRLSKSTLIPLGALRKRLAEIPKNKEIITYCAISLRGYEASLILRAAGFADVKVLDGGIAMWPYEKMTP